MKIPILIGMTDMDKAAWRGFLIGVLITVLTLCPFVLLIISFLISGVETHHVHTP